MMDDIPFAKRRSLRVRPIGGNSRETSVRIALGFDEYITGDSTSFSIAIGVTVLPSEGEGLSIGYWIALAAS